jgi:hypothetical protein
MAAIPGSTQINKSSRRILLTEFTFGEADASAVLRLRRTRIHESPQELRGRAPHQELHDRGERAAAQLGRETKKILAVGCGDVDRRPVQVNQEFTENVE